MACAAVELLMSGMVNGDAERVRRSLSPRVVLRSPILEEAIEGRDAVVDIIGALLKHVDRFELLGIMEGDGLHATAFRYVSGDVRIEGMDLMTLDGDGLVEDLRVFWRPLPTIVAMYRRVAASFGVSKLRLVEDAAS